MNLRPPFDTDVQLYQRTRDPNAATGTLHDQDLFPASSFLPGHNKKCLDRNDHVFDPVQPWRRVQNDVSAAIELEICIPGLAKTERYLWFCAKTAPAKPLHEQIMMNRTIVVSEQPHLHLVMPQGRIFIKPLPLFLLEYDCWTHYICRDAQMYAAATGILLSYIWLVRHRSDLAIAKEHHLLPDDLEWASWAKFVSSTLHNLDYPDKVHPRFLYGEISLPSLNMACRYAPEIGRFYFSPYLSGFGQSAFFFKRNFAWMGLGFLYMTAVLTAKQVGLAVPYLSGSGPFQRASYGFAVFCIILPLMVVFRVVFVHVYYLLRFRTYSMRSKQRDQTTTRL